MWSLIPGTPHYISDCGLFFATYQRTIKGQGSYMVHPSWLTPSARKPKTAWVIGGLPPRHVIERCQAQRRQP